MRDAFEEWLLENYGFEADYKAIRNTPPMFVRADGLFDVEAYERWRERKRRWWRDNVELQGKQKDR
jgi:hypothetical protein